MVLDFPLVSIVVRTHNRAELLREALECLMNQTYSHVEILVVDHNSTDNTREVVHSFGESVRYLLHKGEFHDTFNVWRNEVKGDFVGFLDDDDYLLPECLEKLVTFFMEKADADVVFGRQRFFVCEDDRCRILSETERIYPDQTRKKLMSSNVILWNAVMIRRDKLAKIPLISKKVTGAYDWHFWIHAALANLTFYQVPAILGYVRISSDSVQRELIRMSTGDIECVKYYGSRLKFKDKLAFGYFYSYGTRLIRYGIICMEHGLEGKGRKSIIKGLIFFSLTTRGRVKWLISLTIFVASLISDQKLARHRCERLFGRTVFRNYYERFDK